MCHLFVSNPAAFFFCIHDIPNRRHSAYILLLIILFASKIFLKSLIQDEKVAFLVKFLLSQDWHTIHRSSFLPESLCKSCAFPGLDWTELSFTTSQRHCLSIKGHWVQLLRNIRVLFLCFEVRQNSKSSQIGATRLWPLEYRNYHQWFRLVRPNWRHRCDSFSLSSSLDSYFFSTCQEFVSRRWIPKPIEKMKCLEV